jgi:hypothetical protein
MVERNPYCLQGDVRHDSEADSDDVTPNVAATPPIFPRSHFKNPPALPLRCRERQSRPLLER